MKSINILRFLLLSTTLCLVAFCRSFTCDNTIVLPTTSQDNLIIPAVLDRDGDPLKIGEEYIIQNPFIGGGAVYLDNIGHHKCPNAVVQHIPSIPGYLEDNTPVKFFLKADDDDVVREMTAINIMFSVKKSSTCVNESTVWKVDDKHFVVTGGNESNFFKIMKNDIDILGLKYIYKLLHCPPQLMCKDVGGIMDSGYPRLAVLVMVPLPFVFMKGKDA